jgi:hypothetical protein
MPRCSLLKFIRPEQPTGISPFLLFRGCARDVCDLLRLRSPWLGSRSYYSPTAPVPPSLRLLFPSGSLIRCKPVQVYHHLISEELCFWRLFFRFGEGRPLHNAQSLTSCSVVEDRFSISSSTGFLMILPDILSFLRCSCRLESQFLMPLLHSGSFQLLFSTVGP